MTKVIELAPNYFRGTPWAIRATVYAFSPTYGTTADAYANLEKALQYGSNYRVIYVQAATIYIHLKDWQKAKDAIDKGLAIPFDNIRPLEEKLATQQLKDMLPEVLSHL
jgi:tetratricopeptide (TPR) repeat protein